MATMNVSIPDAMKDWVERQTEAGRYSNASDYVRALIRQDQDRQVALAILQSAISDGLASGPAVAFDPAAFKARMRSNGA